MPIQFSPNAASSMSSIINSIKNDRQVYRWFLIFISLPAIRQKISLQDKIKKEYQTLKKIQIAEIITYAVLALIITAFCLTKQSWVLLGGALPLAVLANLFRKNRGCVAQISEQFLLENIQADELNQQTLYQTCEYFSRQYNTPSLVDIITYQDFTARKALLCTVLLLPFISRFNIWQIWVATIAILLLTLAIVNTSTVLQKLK